MNGSFSLSSSWLSAKAAHHPPRLFLYLGKNIIFYISLLINILPIKLQASVLSLLIIIDPIWSILCPFRAIHPEPLIPFNLVSSDPWGVASGEVWGEAHKKVIGVLVMDGGKLALMIGFLYTVHSSIHPVLWFWVAPVAVLGVVTVSPTVFAI